MNRKNVLLGNTSYNKKLFFRALPKLPFSPLPPIQSSCTTFLDVKFKVQIIGNLEEIVFKNHPVYDSCAAPGGRKTGEVVQYSDSAPHRQIQIQAKMQNTNTSKNANTNTSKNANTNTSKNANTNTSKYKYKQIQIQANTNTITKI